MKPGLLLVALATGALALALPLDSTDARSSSDREIAERDAGGASLGGSAAIPELRVDTSKQFADTSGLLGRDQYAAHSSQLSAGEAELSAPSSASTSGSSSALAQSHQLSSSSLSHTQQSSSSPSTQGVGYLRRLMQTISQKLGMSYQQTRDAQTEMEQMLEADAARGQQKSKELNDQASAQGQGQGQDQTEKQRLVRRVELQAGQADNEEQQMQMQQAEGELEMQMQSQATRDDEENEILLPRAEDTEDENRLIKKGEEMTSSEQEKDEQLRGAMKDEQNKSSRQPDSEDGDDDGNDDGNEDEDGDGDEGLMRLANEVRAWKRSLAGQQAYEDFERMNGNAGHAAEKRAIECAA